MQVWIWFVALVAFSSSFGIASRLRTLNDIDHAHLSDNPKTGEVELSVEVTGDLPEKRHEYYRTWAQKAHNWVGTALIRLRAGKTLFKKWFRLQKMHDDEIELLMKDVAKRLIEMHSSLENLYIEKGTECEVKRKRGGSHGTLAYVFPGQRRGLAWVIHVCDFANEFKGDTSTTTLIHEISHHRGTVDHAYGKKECLKLRAQEAGENADTYSLFVHQLVKQGKGLYEEGSGIMHAKCNTQCDASSWQYDDHHDQELDFIPPLGSCLNCQFKQKTTDLAGWINWAMLNGANSSNDGLCGDGSFEWRVIDHEDCEAQGCAFIQRHQDCLTASQELGLGHEDIPKSARQSDLNTPYGCHVAAGELLFNRDRRSEIDATPEDTMICECRTTEQYAETPLHRVCCVPHECTKP